MLKRRGVEVTGYPVAEAFAEAAFLSDVHGLYAKLSPHHT
jgi:hypothetical protein